MKSFRPAAVLPVILLAGACHVYRPASLAEIQGGERVRALLTQGQFEEFDEHLGGGDRLLEGTVVEAGPANLLLEVPVVTVAEGIRVRSYSQRLRIPVDGVADVEVRSLHEPRTFALAGVVGVALGALAWNQFFRGSRRGREVPPGPPEEDRVVVIQIPFSTR